MNLRRTAVAVPLAAMALAGGGHAASQLRPDHRPDGPLLRVKVADATTPVRVHQRTVVEEVPLARFTIEGDIDGLYPGYTGELTLEITNPNLVDVEVLTLDARVDDASSGCRSIHLTIAPFAGRLVVPALGSIEHGLPVAMSRTAPDPCQGATFPLTYDGAGRILVAGVPIPPVG